MVRTMMVVAVLAMIGCVDSGGEDAFAYSTFKLAPECSLGDYEMCQCPDGRDGIRWCIGIGQAFWSPCFCPFNCGDGTCDASDLEDEYSCPVDCVTCGDGICSFGESTGNCFEDCAHDPCETDAFVCGDDDDIRLCVGDGSDTILVDHCGGGFPHCEECPSVGDAVCAPEPTGTLSASGIFNAPPLSTYDVAVCPDTVNAWSDYEPTWAFPWGATQMWMFFPGGEWLSFVLPSAVLEDASAVPLESPDLQMYGSDVSTFYVNGACVGCTPPVSGVLSWTWDGPYTFGSNVTFSATGFLTPDQDSSWAYQELDLTIVME